MTSLSRRTFLPLLALILLSAVVLLLVPTLIHGVETPSVLLSEEATLSIATHHAGWEAAPGLSWIEHRAEVEGV